MSISLQKSNQLKAVAIMMMLCLHLFNRDHNGLFQPVIFLGEKPLSYYISLFSDACVPIFAFVSGYGLYFKYKQNEENFLAGNISRLKKLYLNLWIIIGLFAVGLGTILGKTGYPGNFLTFLGNFTGLNTTYNGAWWFFTTYVFFVFTCKFWFTLLKTRKNLPIYILILFLLYVVGFYYRIYNNSIFSNAFLHWVHSQAALYFCTLFQFMLGAIVLEYNLNKKIVEATTTWPRKNIIGLIIIVGLIAFHGFIPNLIVAPFTALAFIFVFLQLQLGRFVNRFLDFMSGHSTNIWLIHMFIYMIFFPEFIYSFKYPLVIYTALILCSLGSSYLVNTIFRVLSAVTLNIPTVGTKKSD